MSRDGLLGGVVVDEGARDAGAALGHGLAAHAPAAILDGAKIVGVLLVPHVENAVARDGIAEAGGARRPHAVKHVGAQRHAHHQVLRVADAHDIPRLEVREELRARRHHPAVVLLGLAAAQAADGDARGVAPEHLGGALAPHFEVESALDDTEEVLRLGFFVGGYAAVEPADAALHGLAHAGRVGRGGDQDVVELHHDVGPDAVLQRHGVLRGQQHGAAVVRTEEAHALLGDGGQLEERDHLEAAAVSQEVMPPSLQLVGAADGVEDRLTWLEPKVVRIVQAQPAARVL